MKIKAIPHVLAGGPSRHAWEEAPDGTHVALPLDVSQVSDAVVEKMAAAHHDYEDTEFEPRYRRVRFENLHIDIRTVEMRRMRAAIAALAAALEVEG